MEHEKPTYIVLYLQLLDQKNLIALAIASSGVVAALLPDGRTTHLRFKLPFEI